VASGGTLFLDEIGNLSQPLQAKLLTALQSRQIRKIGSNQSVNIDIRLICATNMPLYDMVQDNSFRQDLLYRINTVEIKLPSLKERRTDIPILANHFLKIYTRKYQKPALKISNNALKELQSYSWPGNIRELRHAVERAVILAEGPNLEISDFILQSGNQQGNSSPTEELDSYNLSDIEQWAIRKALTKHTGNISRAAEELGLTRAALYRRMAKYGL
jgi:two-component system response regulator HydG